MLMIFGTIIIIHYCVPSTPSTDEEPHTTEFYKYSYNEHSEHSTSSSYKPSTHYPTISNIEYGKESAPHPAPWENSISIKLSYPADKVYSKQSYQALTRRVQLHQTRLK